MPLAPIFLTVKLEFAWPFLNRIQTPRRPVNETSFLQTLHLHLVFLDFVVNTYRVTRSKIWMFYGFGKCLFLKCRQNRVSHNKFTCLLPFTVIVPTSGRLHWPGLKGNKLRLAGLCEPTQSHLLNRSSSH